MTKYQKYEQLKQTISNIGLTPEQYQRIMKIIADLLKI